MIIQNFRVILRLESENNTYEVMDPSWGKTNRFGYSRNFSKFSLLSHLFTQGALTLFKISKKFSEWILRGICNKMTHFWNQQDFLSNYSLLYLFFTYSDLSSRYISEKFFEQILRPRRVHCESNL